MEYIGILVSLIVSSLAVIISVISIWVTQKQIYSSIISQNRIDHSKEIRNIAFQFIDLYLSGAAPNKLLVVKAHLDLCLNIKRNNHADLSALLQKFIDSQGLDVNEIVFATTCILQERWERAKLEVSFFPNRRKTIKQRIINLDKLMK